MANKFDDFLTYFDNNDLDVFTYSGPIESRGYREISELIESGKSKSNAILILCTYGGDPNAGYRIARAFNHHYGSENFAILLPSDCKSAGTLICVGAHKLYMSNKSELGPLDIQVAKQDEIFQQSSGLDIVRGIQHLREDALETFNQYLYDINASGGLSTKVSSEIASKLVIGLYEPMFAQVDPVRLGEMSAALQIAHEYGTRLNEKSKSLKADALKKLINKYPSHGFVIDRAEAKGLFERVEKPSEQLDAVGQMVAEITWKNGRQVKPYVLHLNDFFSDIAEEKHGESKAQPKPNSNETPGETHDTEPAVDGERGASSDEQSGTDQRDEGIQRSPEGEPPAGTGEQGNSGPDPVA